MENKQLKYKPEFVQQARNLSELGATIPEIGNFFAVCKKTVDNWLVQYPAFREAVRVGKEVADNRVQQSLYQRAVGYEHEAVKIFCDPKTGAQELVPYTERYAPDVTACIFWLKNRRPDEWRDVKAVEHSGTVKHKHVSELSDAELEGEIEQLKRELAAAEQAEATGTAAGGTRSAKGSKQSPPVH